MDYRPKLRQYFLPGAGIAVIAAVTALLFFLPSYLESQKLEEEMNQVLATMKEDYDQIQNFYMIGNTVAFGGHGTAVYSEEPYLEVNGVMYFPVKEEGIYTLALLQEALDRVYTKEAADKLMEIMTGGEEPLYIERDGKLYRLPADGPVSEYKIPIESAEQLGENEIMVKAAYDSCTESCVMTIILKQENGTWKISAVSYV